MDIKDKIEIGMQERDYSIDILKFLAVFLIINSHMDALCEIQHVSNGGNW